MLRLDPLIDSAEYNTLLHLEELFKEREQDQILPTLQGSSDPAHNSLAFGSTILGY